MVREENDQAARHLKPDDEAKLRTEIFKLASEKKVDCKRRFPDGRRVDCQFRPVATRTRNLDPAVCNPE